MEFRFIGNTYSTGDHYIQVKGKGMKLNIHVNYFLSKKEYTRYLAMMTHIFNVDGNIYYDKIINKLQELYARYGLTTKAVVDHFYEKDTYFDTLGTTEYLYKALILKDRRYQQITTAEESLKKVGLIRIKYKPLEDIYPNDKTMIPCWTRATYLSSILGISAYNKKHAIISGLETTGFIIQTRIGFMDKRIKLKGVEMRGHVIDINFKKGNNFTKELANQQDRHKRKLRNLNAEVFTKITQINSEYILERKAKKEHA